METFISSTHIARSLRDIGKGIGAGCMLDTLSYQQHFLQQQPEHHPPGMQHSVSICSVVDVMMKLENGVKAGGVLIAHHKTLELLCI